MEPDTQYFWMRHGLSYSESWDACQNHLLQISCLYIDYFTFILLLLKIVCVYVTSLLQKLLN